LCSLLLLGAVLAMREPTMNDFAKYIRKFNKQYDSDAEFQLRFRNFKSSVGRITEENKNSFNTKYALNKFSDMSVEEFQSTILMTHHEKPELSSELPVRTVTAVPSTFDWRDKGAVTAVKDQEQCGSCWAFSATENIESMWILAGKGTNSSVDLAPQQIVDCDTVDEGCEGGDTITAFEYVMKAGGLESESDYPYTGEGGNCTFQKQDVVAQISSWHYATNNSNEKMMQTNLLAWGPLSICVDASQWQDYEGGVMSAEACDYQSLDHCVQLVGYNAAEASNQYWIVRNSWNTDWGIEGYIWLQMWQNSCGLTDEATCVIVN